MGPHAPRRRTPTPTPSCVFDSIRNSRETCLTRIGAGTCREWDRYGTARLARRESFAGATRARATATGKSKEAAGAVTPRDRRTRPGGSRGACRRRGPRRRTRYTGRGNCPILSDRNLALSGCFPAIVAPTLSRVVKNHLASYVIPISVLHLGHCQI